MPKLNIDTKKARKIAGEYVQVFQTEIKKIAERFNKKS